jgi:hypothetical protein
VHICVFKCVFVCLVMVMVTVAEVVLLSIMLLIYMFEIIDTNFCNLRESGKLIAPIISINFVSFLQHIF